MYRRTMSRDVSAHDIMNYRSISHLVRGLELNFPNIVSMIILREPISRLISDFFHTMVHNPSSSYSLIAHARKFSNFYVKRLSPAVGVCSRKNIDNEYAFNKCIESQSRHELERTCDYLLLHFTEMFSIVGLFEELQKSVDLLSSLLNYPFDLPFVNMTADSDSEFPSVILAELQQLNDLDMRLYERATVLFEMQFDRDIAPASG